MHDKDIFKEIIKNNGEGIQHVVSEIPVPVEIYDSTGKLVYSNKSFMEIFGVSSEDFMVGKYNILLDDIWETYGVFNEVKGAFGGEINIIQNLKIKLEDFRTSVGSFKKGELILELTLFPMYDNNGKIDYVISFWNDVTKIKNNEYQLNLLTAALESAANGILISDNKGSIKWVNKAFTTLTGYSKEELLGKNPRVLKSGVQDNDFYKALWDTIISGEVWRGEIINRKKDGSLYSELQTITPVKNSLGEIENFIAIKIDISERIKSENELHKLNRELTTISACNRVLIHSTGESELLNEICRVIIEIGGYRFTWIGLADEQQADHLINAAEYGYEDNYLEINKTALNLTAGVQSPLYKAIHDKKIQVINDISSDKIFADWKDEALKREYRSVIVLPLIYNESVLGVLNIYSDTRNSFDMAEIDLLNELADDLSYGINSIRLDVKHKITEKELEESEKRYRLFFKEDVAGDYISTVAGNIIDCNASFLNIFGFNSIDEAKAFDAFKLHPKPETREAIFEKIKKEKIVRGMEVELRTVDGRAIYCIENAWGTFDEHGDITEIKGYIFDITKRKLAENSLKESELKYQELVENINDVFVIIDLNKSIIYVSPAVSLLSGYTPEEVTGKNFENYIYELDKPKIRKNFRATLRGIPEPEEYRIITKSGSLKWVRSSGKPLVRNGKIVGIQGVIFDITQIKETELKLEKAKEKAEESDKLKSEFLAQVSHEIRTPLNVILSYSYLLRDEFKDKISDEWGDFFDSMEQAGKRLLRTIDLILNMSMIQTGHIEINKSYFELSKILSSLYGDFQRFALHKKIELHFINKAKGSIIESDEYILIQIFENLLDNALKYTNEGKVEIILYRNNDSILCVDVADTGIGISKEYLPDLFSPFSQEDTGYSRKFEGNGLGLALVKHYADLVNVQLKVKSEKGMGTTFTVVINN